MFDSFILHVDYGLIDNPSMHTELHFYLSAEPFSTPQQLNDKVAAISIIFSRIYNIGTIDDRLRLSKEAHIQQKAHTIIYSNRYSPGVDDTAARDTNN